MTTKKRILIFTALTGGGHFSSSKAVKELLQNEFEVEIVDIFKTANSFLDALICKGYQNSVYYFPAYFQIAYDLGNIVPLYKDRVHTRLIKLICKKIVRLIDEKQPDLIISIHPYGTMILGILKRAGYFDLPIISIITDYKFHQFYYNDQINACIVGNEYTKKTMICKGINPDIIYPYGIPVKSVFYQSNCLIKNSTYDLSVLIMSGHLGEKHMLCAVASLLKTKRQLKLYIICGQNDKLKESLENLVKKESQGCVDAEIFGYVDNISELMDRSDIIITKPGGLTVTEALNKRLPILIPYCYPAQEQENKAYLVEQGMAINVEKIEDLCGAIERLIDHRWVFLSMKNNIDKHMKDYSMENVVKLCRDLSNNFSK